MSRITLVHWNKAEANVRAQHLRRAGHRVRCLHDQNATDFRNLRQKPPDTFLIDLSRIPSRGRDMAIWLRQQKATRRTPIVFVAGDPDKTRRVRQLIPDATFTEWGRIRSAVRHAIRHAPQDPVVPGTMASYSGRPLPQKLGIRAGNIVALLGAPQGFEQTLGALPDGVRLRRDARSRADVILLFAKSRANLTRRFPVSARALADGGKLWIAWPKKAAGISSDLSQPSVRAFGLAAGFVDYKISALDPTWSGLCFARRASG